MNPEVHEWVAKAEGDLVSAGREYRARKSPNYDSACFHAQQFIEKYLKARLVEAGIYFPRIHDLGQLLNLVVPVEPMWESFRLAFNRVSYYAVDFRYPGEFSTKDDAKEAIKVCREFRKLARQSLGLPVE
jgi:HEPN domain-containing protein